MSGNISLSTQAGLGSDISYYLNSHHIDLHVWAMEGVARCVSVVARASSGVVAEEMLGRPCEDTITLMAEWENLQDGSLGHAVYTASWTAAKADVHSQQRFFCLMSGGEVTADQVNTESTHKQTEPALTSHSLPLSVTAATLSPRTSLTACCPSTPSTSATSPTARAATAVRPATATSASRGS